VKSLLLQIALTFAALSLVSIGGANAVLPEIHRQVVDVLGWMDSATFANLFAIAQAAPGPNVLLVSLIGWRMAGLAGLLTATVAILLPSSLLALVAGRAVQRWAESPWIRLVKRALVPVAIGLILASGIVTARAADHTPLAYGITALAAGFVILSRRNPLWVLGAGTLASIAAARLGA
jgi:chromate transporter